MKYLKSDIEPGELIPNIASLVEKNAKEFPNQIIIREKRNGEYIELNWKQFYENVKAISYNLKQLGFNKGDKMIIYSPNRIEMLEMEIALMSCDGISVPIFAYFNKDIAEVLIKHSDASYIAAAGALQLSRINPDLGIKKIIVFDAVQNNDFKNLIPFNDLLKPCTDNSFQLNTKANSDEICLNMYTSGTMGVPKCVQLTHRNILSQQAALCKVWNLDHTDRFLSYLPWHHSFGGIFERFSALYNAAPITLESGYGKEPKTIMENWKAVKPTVFFSVPKVFQSLVELTKSDKSIEELFFHSNLKFIFTAAAPLPKNISDEFEKRNIPVLEGWGLTETSPCCTLTDPKIKRELGVIGKPIPGVEIRIADDEEIQVKGPNVMKGYYKNDEANKGIFTDDGWYCTGDVGEIKESGLKLVSRKDRVFKLTNGEKVIPTQLELIIQNKCHYLTYAVVVGSGQEHTVALLFPNKKMLDRPNYEMTPDEGCFCPRSIKELGRCLKGCLNEANCMHDQKFSRIKAAVIIDDELTIDNGTLTPSLKISPTNVLKMYKAHLENLYGAANEVKEEVYIIQLDSNNNPELLKTKQNV